MSAARISKRLRPFGKLQLMQMSNAEFAAYQAQLREYLDGATERAAAKPKARRKR